MIRREAVRLLALTPFAAPALARSLHAMTATPARPDLVLAWSSLEGQTRRIATAMAEQATQAGLKVQLVDLAAGEDVSGTVAPSAVIVAASIHFGKHAKDAVQFATRHRDWLGARPSAFVSVCLSEAQESKRADARRYLEEFATATGWKPAAVHSAAGALKYTRYGWIKRAMMKKIAAEGGLPTDTSRDHEFTDWAALRAFTQGFIARA